MFAALQANPGLIIALALCIGCTLVLTLVGLIIRSARPVLFVAGLIAPIVLTFLVGQLVLARMPANSSSPTASLAVHDGLFADRAKLFGVDAPANFIREAKSGLPGILDSAEIAEAGVTLTGETILVAQFSTDDQAKQAAAAYHRAFQLRSTRGDEEHGWRAKRGMQGDFIEMLRTGRHLFVWSGATPETAVARRAVSDLGKNFPALIPAPRAALFPKLQPLGDFFAPLSMKLAGLLLMVILYLVWWRMMCSRAARSGRIYLRPSS